MERRGLIIGTYNTAMLAWTLTSWSLSAPEYQENFLDVPGRNGALDMSAALTNGEPTYRSRTLTARLESSEESRLYREDLINNMVNWLDGWRLDIELPDDPTHYITGRVSVKKEYNDNAHAAVTVTAVCDPWRYYKDEVAYTWTAAAEPKKIDLLNRGRRREVPLLEIEADPATATAASVLISFNTYSATYSWTLGAGTYQLPDLALPPSGHSELTYSGTGKIHISYREAVL